MNEGNLENIFQKFFSKLVKTSHDDDLVPSII